MSLALDLERHASACRRVLVRLLPTDLVERCLSFVHTHRARSLAAEMDVLLRETARRRVDHNFEVLAALRPHADVSRTGRDMCARCVSNNEMRMLETYCLDVVGYKPISAGAAFFSDEAVSFAADIAELVRRELVRRVTRNPAWPHINERRTAGEQLEHLLRWW